MDPRITKLPNVGRGTTVLNGRGESLAKQWQQHYIQQKADLSGVAMLELPSGMRVRAIRPPLLVLVTQGRIPDSVTPLVDRMIKESRTGGGEATAKYLQDEFAKDPLGMYQKITTMMNAVWFAAVLDPVFVEDPDSVPIDVQIRLESLPEEDRIVLPISMVDEEDKAYLFNWAQGVDESVAEFRDGPFGAVRKALDGEGVRDTPGTPAGSGSDSG
jgi:hypothetical protein